MKAFLSAARRSISALLAAPTRTNRFNAATLAGLVLTIAFGAQTATAQFHSGIRPFVDCVEQEYAGGAATNNYIAYFGYSNNGSSTRELGAGGPGNYFFVNPDEPAPQNEVSRFLPGVHPRVVSIVVPIGKEVTWILGISFATATFRDPGGSTLCAADAANSRLLTYQGKLSDGAAAANGAYDLQFQLFNSLTGGTARTTKITLDDVSVTNGAFTVQLDLGANSLVESRLGALSAAGNLKLNPAIMDAQDSFFEISVRAGTSTGAYTVLTPRQPLTAVPLAMRANTANNAFRAANADHLGGREASQFVQTNDARLGNARTPTAGSANYIQNSTAQQTNSNFNISGNGTIGGNLTVGGAISGVFGQTAATAFGTAALTIDSAANNYAVVPGLAQTLTVPANAALVISTDGGIQSQGAANNSYSVVDVAVFVDNQAVAQRRIVVGNNPLPQSVNNWSFGLIQTLAAGSHTVEVRARSGGVANSSNASVSSGSDVLLKSQLTVVVVKR